MLFIKTFYYHVENSYRRLSCSNGRKTCPFCHYTSAKSLELFLLEWYFNFITFTGDFCKIHLKVQSRKANECLKSRYIKNNVSEAVT